MRDGNVEAPGGNDKPPQVAGYVKAPESNAEPPEVAEDIEAPEVAELQRSLDPISLVRLFQSRWACHQEMVAAAAADDFVLAHSRRISRDGYIAQISAQSCCINCGIAQK